MWLAANGLLLALTTGAVLLVQVSARDWAAVEGNVRRYAAAISASNPEAALAEIVPDQRATWAPFVDEMVGDHYDVKSIAVRTPSLLARLTTRAAMRPIEVTTTMDVNKDVPGAFYQPTTRVPVVIVDGHAYLGAPLLALP